LRFISGPTIKFICGLEPCRTDNITLTEASRQIASGIGAEPEPDPTAITKKTGAAERQALVSSHNAPHVQNVNAACKVMIISGRNQCGYVEVGVAHGVHFEWPNPMMYPKVHSSLHLT
jgi:hypothetical protein